MASLKNQGAKIDVWGVGTKLATAYDQPALGGVYKLAALKNEAGEWENKVKLSEQTIKTSTPGIQQVRRYRNERGFVADMIFDVRDENSSEQATMIDPYDFTRQRTFANNFDYEELLQPIFRAGKQIYELPSIEQTKLRVQQQLAQLHEGTKRFVNPHTYQVGLEKKLFDTKTALILKLRGGK